MLSNQLDSPSLRRDNRGSKLLWLGLLVQRHEDTSQEGVKNFHTCFLNIFNEMRSPWNDVKVIDEDGYLSRNMTIKANLNRIGHQRDRNSAFGHRH